MNRVAAWVIGTRSTLRALLQALLEPINRMRGLEATGDLTARLAWQEAQKDLPAGAVWDMYCLRNQVPIGATWLSEVSEYENRVLSQRR
jgi:L-rhamnose isomerase